MRLVIMGLMALVLFGCTPELRQAARASCALTKECYAPGVTPGTNPYNTHSVTTTTGQSKYIIPTRGRCPNRYAQYSLKKTENGKTYGERICHYG